MRSTRRSALLVAALVTAACGADRGEPGASCCPPPAEAAEPLLRTTPEGDCVQRWSSTRGCLHVSYDPALEGRATEIADVLALWAHPDEMPCFEPPRALDAPPGDGTHWLHLRPSDAFIADETLALVGDTGIIRQASLELPADEFSHPLVYRVGAVLGLEPARPGTDSVMAGAARPTDADRVALGWAYGADSACEQ